MKVLFKKITTNKKEIAKRSLAIATIAMLMIQFIPMSAIEAASDLYTTKANITWIKNIASSKNDNFNALIPIDVSSGTGYIAVGNTASTTADGDIPAPVKVSSNTNAIISKVVMKDGVYDSQQSWTKRFGGSTTKTGSSGGDSFSAVIKATHYNGGYVVAGYCDIKVPDGNLSGVSARVSNKTAMAEKFKEDGTVAWSTPLIIGGDKASEFAGITETADGDIIAVGYTDATTTNDFLGTTSYGSYDAIIVKINGQTGQKEWIKRYGTSGKDSFTGIKSAASGYVIAGYADVSGNGVFNANSTFQLDKNGSSDAVVALINDTGDITKIKNVGGSSDEQFNSVITAPDGGFTVAGISKSKSISNLPSGVVNVTFYGYQDGFIAKFDADLNISWVKDVGNSASDNLYGLIDNGDGYIAIGDTSLVYNCSIAYSQGFAVKLSYTGEVTNANDFYGSGSSKPTSLRSVIKEGNDGYITAGNTKSISINDSPINLNGTGIASTYTDAIFVKFNFAPDDKLANKKGIYADDGTISYNSPISNAPTLKWFTDLGGAGIDEFGSNKVLAVSNNSYIAAGSIDTDNADGYIDTKNSPYGGTDGVVAKFTTNSEGKTLTEWVTYIGGSGGDNVNSITKAVDGIDGVIAAGSTGYSASGNFANVGTSGNSYGYAIKINADGTVDDTKKYIMTVPGIITNIECSKDKDGNIDGYFALEGITTAAGQGSTTIIKLDKNLNIVATESLFTDSTTSINSITQDKTGDYVLAGVTMADNIGGISTGYTSGNAQDTVIIKVDSLTCKVKAVNRIGGSGSDIYTSVQSTQDGGIIAVGYTESNDGDMNGKYGNSHHGSVLGNDALMVKYDKDMNVEWMRQIGGSSQPIGTFPGRGKDFMYSVCQAADGSYITVGTTNSVDDDFKGLHAIDRSDGQLEQLAFIAKVSEEKDASGNLIKDSSGKVVTALSINKLSYNTTINSVNTTSDGGYIATGNINGMDYINGIKTGRTQFDTRGNDGIIMKFSKIDDLDGDGMPNERDYYPNDSSKSFLDASNSKDLAVLNAIDVDKTNIKQTVSGGSKDGVYSASISHDELSRLSAGVYENNGDSKAVNLDNVETVVPVQFLDSIIGKNFSSKISFTKSASSDSKKTAEKSAAISQKDVFLDAFDLGVTMGSTAVENFAGKVKVTVSLSSEMTEELKHAGTPKLYKYNETDKKLEDMNASFDLSDKKAVFYTTELAGSYSIVLPEAKADTFSGVAEGQDGLYKASGYVDFIPDSGNIQINFNDALTESISVGSIREKISSGSFNFGYTNVVSDEDTKKIKIDAPSNFTYIENAASNISLKNDSGESIKGLGDNFQVTEQLSYSVLKEINASKGTKKPKLYLYNKTVDTLEEVSSVFDLDKKTVTFSTKQFGIYIIGLYQTSTIEAGSKGIDGAYAANGDVNSIPNTGAVEFNFNGGSFTVNIPVEILKNKITNGNFILTFSDSISAEDTGKLEALRSKDFSYIAGGVFEISLFDGLNIVHELGGNTTITLKLSSTILAAIKASQSVMIPKVYYYNKDSGKVEEVANPVFDLVNGTVSFKTNHFSTYVIGLAQIVTSNPVTNDKDISKQSASSEQTTVVNSGTASTALTGNTAANTTDTSKGLSSAAAADNNKEADSSKKTSKKAAAVIGGMPKTLMVSLIAVVLLLVGTAVGMIMYDRKKKLENNQEK